MKERIKAEVWNFTCSRCGYNWQSLAEKPPKGCAKCKTDLWDKERIKPIKKFRKPNAQHKT
jgi:hypothetical protein